MYAFLPILALAVATPGQDATAVRCTTHDAHTSDGVLAAERRWVEAIEHRNKAMLDCVLDPAFTDFDWRGIVHDRADVLNSFAAKPQVQLALDQLKVKISGDMAVVRGRNRQADATGKTIGAVRFTDVFVYRSGSWRALGAQETLIR